MSCVFGHVKCRGKHSAHTLSLQHPQWNQFDTIHFTVLLLSTGRRVLCVWNVDDLWIISIVSMRAAAIDNSADPWIKWEREKLMFVSLFFYFKRFFSEHTTHGNCSAERKHSTVSCLKMSRHLGNVQPKVLFFFFHSHCVQLFWYPVE